MPTFPLANFTGIDESQGPTNGSPATAYTAHNIDTNQNVLKVSKGYRRVIDDPAPGPITRIMRFDQRGETGAQTHILIATDDAVYVRRDDAWFPLYTGALSGDWSYIVWEKDSRDMIIMGNGLDPVKKWYGDTDALEDLEGLPKVDDITVKFKYLTLHKERLWGAGDPLSPDGVYYSRAFDPEKWSGDELTPIKGGGVILLPQHDGSFINGLKLSLGDVLIFFPNKAVRIYGDNPDNYQQVSVRGSFGPVSNESVVDAGTMTWFLTTDGLGYYDGMSTGLIDDRKITSVFRRVTDGARPQANGIMHGNVLYMALPLDGSEACNAILEFDTVRQTYMLHEGILAQDFAFSNAVREKLLIAAGDRVCSMEGDTLDGKPIQAIWASPWFDLGSKTQFKSLMRLHAHGTVRMPDELLAGRDPGGAVASVLFTVESERAKVRRKVTVRNRSEGLLAASMLLTGKRFRVTVENVAGSVFTLDAGIELDMNIRKAGF